MGKYVNTVRTKIILLLIATVVTILNIGLFYSVFYTLNGQ